MENSGKKILIVEDDKPILKAMELKLKSSGFDVTTAEDGQIALDHLKDNKADLILLDIVMPVVDGFGVLKELNNGGDKTPVIILSNLGQKEDIDKAKKLGAKDYFVKSDIDLNEIVDKVAKFL
jgi:DNA-binding response OmpR family regulator